MEIALVVGLTLILFLSLFGIVLAYSHFVFNKNRIFTKVKYSILWIILISIITALMLIAGIIFCLDKNINYVNVCVSLCFINFILGVCYVLYFSLLPKLVNKNKINYLNIANVDYEKKINDLMQKIGDLDRYKKKLIHNNPKYFNKMLKCYDAILKRLQDRNISITEKVADIVIFNDSFTYKWSFHSNFYQEYLTYKFCQILKKIYNF